MKQKIYYLLTFIWISLLSSGQTLDQSCTPTLVGNSNIDSGSQNLGQTFTAGTSAYLSQLNVQFYNDGNTSNFNPGNFIVTIYNGNGYTGTVLGTTTFSVGSIPTTTYQEVAITLTNPISITSGNMYTFDIRGIGTAKARLGWGGPNAYAGGGMLYNGGLTGLYNTYDLWFKSYTLSSIPATHLNFDGVDDFVNLGTTISSSLDNTNNLTLEAWIRPTVLNGWNNIVCDYNGSTMKYLLRVRNNNNIQFWINGTTLNSSFVVPLNTWTHIAAVYNGTTMSVYANGALIASQAYTGNFPASSNQTNIGSRVGGTENFTGSIDDVRIWNTARTIEQINGSKNCELQGTESGLLAYYKFNQGTDQANNTTVTTLNATTGPNGTLTNFALNGTTSNWLAGSPVTSGSIIPGAATVTTPINYLQGDSPSALTATTGTNGSGLMWYTTATGGTGSTTAPTPSTTTIGSTSYWVSSTNANGCESARVEIIVTINTAATHLNFDGVDDLVNCGNTLNSTIDPLNTITVEAWVKPTTNTGLGVIIGNYATPNQSVMQFLLRRENNNYGFWIQGTGTFKNVTATNSVVLNTWQHVVGVWNGSDLKIYINGVLAGTTTGVTDSSFASTTNNIFFGNNQFSGNPEEFTGNIDDVRIWSTARTIEQINNSKNCELQGSETGLIAYYKFNQGGDQINNSGVTTLNATTGPNGTLTNFALNGTTSNWLAGSPVTTGSMIPSVPSVTTPVTYNQGDVASALTATIGSNGTGLLWYTSATGGSGSSTAPTPSTATAGNTSYWVSSTNANGCESARVEIVVTVNAPSPATHLNFDGTDDVVNLGNSLTTFFTGKTQVTLQAWVRPETTSSLGHIVGNYNYPTNINAMQMMLRRDGSNYAFWLDSGSGYTSITAVGSVVLNTWQHITGTWDGTTMKIYINGVLANSTAKTGTIPSKTTSFSIGANDGEKFDGDIDEVRIWDKALTATDIMNTMNCEAQSQPELVAYYKLNQGLDAVSNTSVTVATDSSGNGYNGTLTNFGLTSTTSNWRSGSNITTGNTCALLNSTSIEQQNKFVIYPNPSNGIFNIDTTENIVIEIYDLIGKSIIKKQMSDGTNNLDISNFNAGVYLLKITTVNGNSETHKLIKN